MRSFTLLALISSLVTVTAFLSKVAPLASQTSRMFAAKKDQTVKDLNLEQMFDVFEKADNTVTIPKGSSSSGKSQSKSKVIYH